MSIEITEAPIDVPALIERTRNEDSGAIVTFQGTVRRHSGELEVESLTYDSYREMAEKTMEAIVKEAVDRFEVTMINVVHRLGNVKLKEDSVAVCVSSPHRKDGFRACEFVIDEIKTRVPIWKMDITPKGEKSWRD